MEAVQAALTDLQQDWAEALAHSTAEDRIQARRQAAAEQAAAEQAAAMRAEQAAVEQAAAGASLEAASLPVLQRGNSPANMVLVSYDGWHDTRR